MSTEDVDPDRRNFLAALGLSGLAAGLPGGTRDRGPMLSGDDVLTALLSGLHAQGSTIDVKANDYEFAKAYNLRADGNPITGDSGIDGDYEHLLEPYMDDVHEQVIMAGAQTGKTVRVFVRLARIMLGPAWGQHAGYYFPDAHLPREFSNSRFRPFVRSNEHIGRFLGARRAMEDGSEMKGKDATQSMTLGESYLHFLTIAGKTATEGMPLRMTLFDEVRRMNDGDIERAHFRKQGQRDPYDIKVSTAGFPKTDIHRYFLAGDQRYYHSACKCPDGIVLSERWPDCVMDLAGVTPKVKRQVEAAFRNEKDPYFGLRGTDAVKYSPAAYYCPTCGTILANPRRGGWWQARHEGRFVHSYQLPGMLSVANPAGKMLHQFRQTVDMDEFNKSARGLPSVNPDQMPVQAEHIDACVNPDLEWGERLPDAARRRLTNCAMGIDVQAGYGVAVIKRMQTNGKPRVVHVEVLRNPSDGTTWWHRAAELMQRYDIRTAVVDHAPEFTAAKNFADAFSGRVFLADFTGDEDGLDTVVWPRAGDKKQKGETANLFRVRLARTKALHWSVHLWKNRRMEIPPLRRLTQSLKLDTDGTPVFSAHLRNGMEGLGYPAEVLRSHLTRFVFRDLVEDDSKRGLKQLLALRHGKKRYVAEWVEGSPDLAFADMYCNVALTRAGSLVGPREVAHDT